VCGGTGYMPADCEEVTSTQTRTESLSTRRADSVSVRQQMKDHHDAMEKIYSALDRKLEQQWMKGKYGGDHD
jgi:hypothetical protein